MSETNENQSTENNEAQAAELAAAQAAAAQEKAAAKAAKAAAKEADKVAKAAKETTRQPEQNGIRRPGPAGACGRVWALADALSQTLGQAVPIANLLEAGLAENLNPSNIRVEYARWKKFHGLSGRIVLAKPEAEAAPATE